MSRVWLVAVLCAAIGAGSTLPAVAADDSAHSSDNMQLVGHADNPLRQGGSHYFINSDIAFSGDYLVQGNYDGFSVWDISAPTQPTLVSAVQCAGSQGDISVVGNLVVLSIDDTMSSDRCDAERVAETEPNWEGLRIFDISNPSAPEYVRSVQTRCGSHTNTVVPTADPNLVYVYVSAYSRGASLNCSGLNPMQVVELRLDNPQAADVVSEIALFEGRDAFGPGDLVDGGAQTRSTTGCHDITVFGTRAAAACRGDGLYLDIADPLAPVVLDQVRDPEVSFWHSAIFSNDGNTVVYQDEMGDGMTNTCSPEISTTRGADAFWGVSGDRLSHLGYFKIPRDQSDAQRCTSHNGSVIPVPGKNYLVQAWYEGGVSVIDFTDPAAATEIGFYESAAYDSAPEYSAGYWAAYYYNGYIYASNMWDGLDVIALTGPEFSDAERYVSTGLNPQTQPAYAWVWKNAPTLPEDRSGLASLHLTPAVRALPRAGSAAAAEPLTVEVSAADGSFAPGDRVDVWDLTSQTVLASTQATATGALAPIAVQIAAPTQPGVVTLVARGDQRPEALAWAELTLESPPTAGIDGWTWVLLGMGALLLTVVGLRARVLLRMRRQARKKAP